MFAMVMPVCISMTFHPSCAGAQLLESGLAEPNGVACVSTDKRLRNFMRKHRHAQRETEVSEFISRTL